MSGRMAQDVTQPRTLTGSASNSGPIASTTSSGTTVDSAPAHHQCAASTLVPRITA